MKEQPRTLRIMEKKLQIPQKVVYEKLYIHEKVLRTRNCRRKFIKNLFPEKLNENM